MNHETSIEEKARARAADLRAMKARRRAVAPLRRNLDGISPVIASDRLNAILRAVR